MAIRQGLRWWLVNAPSCSESQSPARHGKIKIKQPARHGKMKTKTKYTYEHTPPYLYLRRCARSCSYCVPTVFLLCSYCVPTVRNISLTCHITAPCQVPHQRECVVESAFVQQSIPVRSFSRSNPFPCDPSLDSLCNEIRRK